MKATRIIVVLIIAVSMAVLMAASRSPGWAQALEFTPGPRMIRAMDHIAQEYLDHADALELTTGQRQRIGEILRQFKKDMWRKEAVLVGMFMGLETKRRYGLLEEGEYQGSNFVTGGIETDELNLLVDTLETLQGVLSQAQGKKLRALWKPDITLRVPQGVTTKIGLFSLQGIGRIYNGYAEPLRLSDHQLKEIRTLVEKGRREVLELGTKIDINRTEAYDLLESPEADPVDVRVKMQKTGEMEGVLFEQLFNLSDQVKAVLTADQRASLQRLKHARRTDQTTRPSRHDAAHGKSHSEEGTSLEEFTFFLDQIDALELTGEQIAKLVALKNDVRNEALLQKATIKGAQLDVVQMINGGSEAEAGTAQVDEALNRLFELTHQLNRIRIEGYLKARAMLTDTQRKAAPALAEL